MTNKTDIKSLDFNELENLISSMGEKSFRARQIYNWLHIMHVNDFEQMSNISKKLRADLKEKFEIRNVSAVKTLKSDIDGTTKFLFKLCDGAVIESVLMEYRHGNSVCISTQVGCRMGCRFCASTLGGLERNLCVSELLGQIYEIENITGERASNIVLMGSGEPLDNYDNVVKFIRMISDENGANISQRSITLSTCGLVPELKKLADEGMQITLAISLHAPDDRTRKELMPIARRYSIDEVIGACIYFFERTGRRITFEYSLVEGVNDTKAHADALSELLRGMNCHLNLIPVNPVKERKLNQPDKSTVIAFKNMVEKNRINVTIRREMGRDIDGACGQLRKSFIKNEQKEREVKK